MAQYMINLSRDLYFHFCRYGDPDALIPFMFMPLSWQEGHPTSFQFNSKKQRGKMRRGEEGGEYSGCCESRCKNIFFHFNFLSHPAAHSSPKLYIITTICAPRETVWNLIAIGNIRSKSPGMIEGFVFQFPRIPQVLVALFFIPSVGHTFPFRGKNRPGNIQFTRRQRRWFHWQYNNMLHGA